ncbi:hypothetical protein Acr_25g0000300 [Actinidia rufa]|uniref:Uncharacterized protein n=1 Tax=Actinidia rufa TaxID=165716 RepID=A0A7J0GXX7_9ERIC|nr:hypothetical protein Acr_25g0000300 [Actinidia rufa]
MTTSGREVLDPGSMRIFAHLNPRGRAELVGGTTQRSPSKKRRATPLFKMSSLKQVMDSDSTKDHDTSLGLVRVVMLPMDIVDLVEEGLEEIWDLMVMQQVQSLQGVTAVSERMRQQSVKLKKTKKKPTEEGGKEAQGNEATEPEGEEAVEEVGEIAAEAGKEVAEVGEAITQDPPNKL